MTFKQTYPALFFTAFSFTILSIPAFSKTSLTAVHSVQVSNIKDTVPAMDTGKIFENVEEEAYFPGKAEGWLSYLQQNLNPEVPIRNGAPAGTYTVYIQFVVDLDGKVTSLKPLTKNGYGMEAEVMRILRKSPPWVPAVQFGKNVKAFRKQPVTFQVVDERKKKRGKG